MPLKWKSPKRGGITVYLGTDDELGRTTLSGTDLFEDTFDKISNIKNLNGHPFEFYIKKGYKIVGVVPDANGIGKPDIIMAEADHSGMRIFIHKHK